MFSPGSRYAGQPIAVHVDPQGRPRAYVALREVPAARVARPEDPVHIVSANDRLDRVTWRYLGDPELFWRICDANGALDPDEMTSVIGRRLLVPLDPRAGDR
jgi:hypothetical protein